VKTLKLITTTGLIIAVKKFIVQAQELKNYLKAEKTVLFVDIKHGPKLQNFLNCNLQQSGNKLERLSLPDTCALV
jgi:hypothetical protein